MLNITAGRRDLIVALGGRMISTFGDEVALVALTLRLQGDGAQPWEVGLLLGAGVIPVLLLARPVGRLVDAHDSRLLLVSAGIAETACTVPLIFLHSVVPMVLLVAALGAAASVSGATWSALVPRLAGEDHIAGAVSAQQSLSALAMVGAPAIGGVLAGAFGSGLPLAIDAATFVAVTVAAAAVRTRRVPAARPGPQEPARVRGGFEIVRADRVLAPLVVGAALVVLLVGMVDVVLVFLVRQTFQAGAVWFGVAGAAWMAGMVAGSVATGRIGTDRARARAVILGMGVTCAALALFAVVPDVWMLLPLSVLGGAANGYAATCLSALLVSRTPEHERGRVSAAANAVFGGAQGISLLAGGAIAAVLSPRDVYAVAGLLGVVAAIVVGIIDASRTSGRLRIESQPAAAQASPGATSTTAAIRSPTLSPLPRRRSPSTSRSRRRARAAAR
jgi:MFS family permease